MGQSRTVLKDRVSRLARRIDVEVFESNATNTVLRQSQNDLKRILDRLKGSGDSSPMECINFALPIYEKYHSSTRAIQLAKETCRGVSDLSVLKFVFGKLKSIYSEKRALERSAEVISGIEVYGKSEILKFSYEKHIGQYSSSRAIDKAISNTAVLKIDALECIQTYYPTHSRRYSSSRAMDMTTETCSDI